MNHLFVDTNVIIDFLSDRKPFSEHASFIFDLAEKKKLTLHVSAISINNIYYVTKQLMSHYQSIALLKELMNLVNIIDLTESILDKSLKSGFNDFEDSIQYYSALTNKKIQAIVTRNVKDFKKSSIPIFTPYETISFLSEKKE